MSTMEHRTTIRPAASRAHSLKVLAQGGVSDDVTVEQDGFTVYVRKPGQGFHKFTLADNGTNLLYVTTNTTWAEVAVTPAKALAIIEANYAR
jgi:hypothetical protein